MEKFELNQIKEFVNDMASERTRWQHKYAEMKEVINAHDDITERSEVASNMTITLSYLEYKELMHFLQTTCRYLKKTTQEYIWKEDACALLQYQKEEYITVLRQISETALDATSDRIKINRLG